MNIDKITNYISYTIKNIFYFDQIPSTHLYAKKIANALNTNTLIISNSQTEGIGSHNNHWYSGNNNLLFSIIIYSEYDICKLEHLSYNIANIISDCIFNLYGYTLKVKFPNDLYLNSKKICRHFNRNKMYS